MVPTTGIVHQFDPNHPVAGGIESCIFGIIRYAPDDETLVIVGADRGDAAADRGSRARLGVLRWLDVDGRRVGFLPVARLGRHGRAGRVPETVTLVLGLARFRRQIRETVDHLQVHRSETGAVVAALLPRLPRVQCIHGDSARALRHRSASYWRFLRGTHLAVERWSVRRAKRTFVFSRSGARRIAERAPRVTYLPTWYDPGVVRTRIEATDGARRRAVWVGRLEEEKDPVLGLETLDEFIGGDGTREASMLGDGSLRDAVARARSSDSRVELRGAVDAEEVAAAMVAADVLLMTSRFEGSPVVMNEALAAGTPVVATEESDPDAFIDEGQNGFRCPSRAPEALAAAMEAACSLSRVTCIESVRNLSAPAVVPRLFEPR